MPTCRICGSSLQEFSDFGKQPLSDAFITADRLSGEFFYRLAVGSCTSCGLVQLMEEVPRDKMFHEDYPYYSSGSAVMRAHFEGTARHFLETELTGADPFIVEIGCNDGVMLGTVAEAKVPHLGVEPSSGVADVARSRGVSVLTDFFEERTATQIRREHGAADVVFSANTICHIPYLDSIFAGLDALLKPAGIFVFEDPYWGDIVERTSFDQIYDEHFYYFTARSVRAMARRFGFDLVDVEPLPVHGGEIRYTVARRGARTVSPAVAELIAEEDARGLTAPKTLESFHSAVMTVRDDLVALLEDARSRGERVVAYGATAKSATVANLCGLGPEFIEFVCDTTPAKQGRLTPGTHIPVKTPDAFSDPYPDYALLFAWNHAAEIMAKETAFTASGGRWILYVPDVHVTGGTDEP
jgi:methylation protein EvaC